VTAGVIVLTDPGPWEYLYAVFEGIFWPAYMVHAAFAALAA
jgi:hypothetical protein